MIKINLMPKFPKDLFRGWVEYHVDILDQEAKAYGIIISNEEFERRRKNNELGWFHIEN